MAYILILNAGSSSLKFAVYSVSGVNIDPIPLVRGLFELSKVGTTLSITSSESQSTKTILPVVTTHATAILVLMEELDVRGLTPDAVGHRVVHGGGVYTEPKIVDTLVYKTLEGFVPLAPLHQPHNLAPIVALIPNGIPQVACFDTGFHGTIAPLNYQFALPLEWRTKGYRKFGFHGLSYEYIASVLPGALGEELADGKIVVAHLGSGSSMCAMKERKSVMTTLEFSTIGRLTMGTRPGAIDAVMALMMASEAGIDEVMRMLHKDCGLLGLSGISDDVRDLESAATEGNELAIFALDFFAEQVVQEFGKLVAGLRGVDALVFTAGIGERGSKMRARICEQLDYFGVALDSTANDRGKIDISAPNARVRTLILPTNEEYMIALHTAKLLF